MISPQLRALLVKELLQVRRSRGAMLSATLLPVMVMVAVPLGQALAARGTPGGAGLPSGAPVPPGLAGLTEDPAKLFVQALLPLYMTLGGLIVPAISASYTIVAEREKRSLELLIALPVGLADILFAKLLAMLALALAVVLPLFALDVAVLLALGLVSPLQVLLLLLVVVAALGCSIGIALLLALLARDFRTANNLNGALIGPLILVTLAVVFSIPGEARLLVLAAVLAGAGAAAFAVGLRWLTFERYLS